MLRRVTFPADLSEWEGWCVELVGQLIDEHGGSLLWVEPRRGPLAERWKHHAALVLDGLVYDAWHPTVRLPPAEYVAEVFGKGTPWELDPGKEGET